MSSSVAAAAAAATPKNHSDHDDHHHVHFDKKFIEDDFEKDNSIAYERSPNGAITIHLGFLQILHRYSIELAIPKHLFEDNGGVVEATPQGATTTTTVELELDESSLPNIHCKIIEAAAACDTKLQKTPHHDDCVLLNLEFNAHREKLVKEELHLVNKSSGSKVKIVLISRVLGRGKGTPMLRNGIHCVGVDHDDESEASDWQGFHTAT